MPTVFVSEKTDAVALFRARDNRIGAVCCRPCVIKSGDNGRKVVAINYFGGPSLRLKLVPVDLRVMAIHCAFALAQCIDVIDTIVTAFKDKTEQNPTNADAKADLLLVYEAGNKFEEAMTLGEELLAMRPDDAPLMQRVAMIYQRQNLPDKVIALYERFVTSDPGMKRQLTFQLVPLYMQAGRQDEAMVLVDAILKENPDRA